MGSNIINWTEGEPIYLFGNFRVYTFTMLLGIIASTLTVLYFWRKNKYPIEILLTLIIITIPSAIIGARLFWIIESAINKDTESLSKWYAIWEGGLSIQGGVFVPTIVDLLYLRKKKTIVDIRKCFGIILPSVLIGQAIGRWGNFANHELYGASLGSNIYDVPNSIEWLGPGIYLNMFINNEYHVPLFLIESFLSLVGYIVIVWVLLQLNIFQPGTTGGIYLIWYGVVRTILEPLRIQEDFEIWYLSLAIIFIIVGIALSAYFELTGIKIYQKYKVSKYSFFYHNTKVPIIPINVNSKWINE